MLRYAVNISILLKEYPFYERFQRAAQAGFGAVEFLSPFEFDLEQVVAAKEAAGVEVVQFNTDCGNMAAGDRGFLNDPGKREYWRRNLLDSLALARRLGARQINSLAGNHMEGLSRQEELDCVAENLRWAVPGLEEAGLYLNLEVLNPFDNPCYLLTHSSKALAMIHQVGSDRIRLQYDIYHIQRCQGNLVEGFKAMLPFIGHVQVADSPGRHQPGTGEINYRYVLQAIEDSGYTGFVSLEYNPLGSSEESFAWLSREKRRAATAADLRL
ncbi:MAG: TIM barrel protein [Chloroflexi bacterium]|nr:TIM barrel protein [Chloroflexota bacterium]